MKNELVFISGNENKKKEFSEMIENLNCISSNVDIQEIESQNEELVTIHKLKDIVKVNNLDSSKKYFIEDTSLQIEGVQVGTNIKHVLNSLYKYAGHRAVWYVTLATFKDNVISLYQGKVAGIITKQPFGKNGFGFDQHFIPFDMILSGEGKTLAEIDKTDKHKYSARYKAVQALKNKQPIKEVKISDIGEWNGSYQKD